MKKFIFLATGQVLSTGEIAAKFEGPFGDLQKSGEAVWLDVPSGENPEDCDFVATPSPALVVNAAKKAKSKTKADRKAALDAIDYTKKLSNDELDTVARAWLAERRGD